MRQAIPKLFVLMLVLSMAAGALSVYPAGFRQVPELFHGLFQDDFHSVRITGVNQAEKMSIVEKTINAETSKNSDINRIRIALEALEWIQEARVRRAWPDVLEVEVVEKTAVAHWGPNQFLDDDGNVYGGPVQSRDLPTLFGRVGAEKQIMSQYQKLNQVVARTGQRIDVLKQDERGAWSFEMNGITVRLGQEDVMQRMSRFIRVYKSIPEAGENIASIDTRYPNGVAVLRKTVECKVDCVANRE